MAEYKKFGAAKKLVVAGCLVERYRNEIRQQIPEVDYVIGTNELESILLACADQPQQPTGGKPAEPYLYHEFTPRVLSTPGYSAYLKIAEGCDHPCTFCVIPQMRGAFRSRGFRLGNPRGGEPGKAGRAGTHHRGTGHHQLRRRSGPPRRFATLLRELGRIPELVWVRFLYCYPNRVTDALIAAVAENTQGGKVFRHSAAARQRERSETDGSAARTASSSCACWKRFAPPFPASPCAPRSSVGFPGETDDDFKALLDFAAAAEFDHLGVFLYSNEESSRSFDLPNAVPAPTARRRQKQLMALQRKISRHNLRKMVGKSLPVLVEGPSEETDLLYQGRMERQAPGIDGCILINDFEGSEPQRGDFRWATITEVGDYDLVARP